MKIEAIKIDGVEYVVKSNNCINNVCGYCEFSKKESKGRICDLCYRYFNIGEYPVRKEKDND